MASRIPALFSGGFGERGLQPLMDLQREFNRLFEDMFSDVGALASTRASAGGLLAMPRLDVREGDKELCITAELPGVRESDIDLRVEGDMLILRGEKKSEIDQQQQNYRLMERSYGQFHRAVQLPFAPDPEQVQASFEHGVLTIRMPRPAHQERGRRIEIRSGGQQPEQLTQGGGSAAWAGSEEAGQGAHLHSGDMGASQQAAPAGASTH